MNREKDFELTIKEAVPIFITYLNIFLMGAEIGSGNPNIFIVSSATISSIVFVFWFSNKINIEKCKSQSFIYQEMEKYFNDISLKTTRIIEMTKPKNKQ